MEGLTIPLLAHQGRGRGGPNLRFIPTRKYGKESGRKAWETGTRRSVVPAGEKKRRKSDAGCRPTGPQGGNAHPRPADEEHWGPRDRKGKYSYHPFLKRGGKGAKILEAPIGEPSFSEPREGGPSEGEGGGGRGTQARATLEGDARNKQGGKQGYCRELGEWEGEEGGFPREKIGRLGVWQCRFAASQDSGLG